MFTRAMAYAAYAAAARVRYISHGPGAAAAEWMAAAARAKRREAGKAAALAAAQWIFVAGAAADRRRLRRAYGADECQRVGV